MLASRAIVGEGDTASVLTARPVVAALERRGIDPQWALQTAGLSKEALDSIDARLPAGAMRALWQVASEVCCEPSFGIHVAEELPDGAYDVFEYLLSTASTVGEGISSLAPHVRLIEEHSGLRLVIEPRCARLLFLRARAPGPQYDEFSLALFLLRSRGFCGIDWTPELVTFRHDRAHDDGEPERVFGTRVRFGQAQVELRFPRAVLELPHVRADSVLLSILTRYADSLLAALPARGALAARVSSSIARQTTQGPPTLERTAEDVRMPERTLQRRLAAEGTNYSTLVDEVRRGLALKYVGHAGMSISEIAYLLHLAPSALHRAFKVLELSHTRADSVLLSILMRYADSLLAALPARGALVARVSSSIAHQIAHGAPTLTRTARDVHVPERTLQRQLAAQGTSHSMLVDRVRRDLALKYIAHAAISIGEIAYLLHFTPSAFHRAFRRWTGASPLRYRRQLFS